MKRVTRGEIVQVEGGHILRSTGRKDRHSKVYTAKGPRDRRVRLSAHTAIQFYDVQDRLGYDRPSKAVDWLIKKAKNSIDKLAELPPWNPNDDVTNIIHTSTTDQPGDAGSCAMVLESIQMQLPENPSNDSSYMIQMRAEESQSIANNASKPFFLMNSGTSLMNFQSYPHEDLGLSLHTLHDQSSNHRTFSSTTNPVSFEAAYPRMASWVLPHQQQLFSNGSAFLQREPLQSNFSNLIHSWEDRSIANNSSISNTHFNGNFQFPVRIHDEDEHGGVSIKTSSVSPNSAPLNG